MIIVLGYLLAGLAAAAALCMLLTPHVHYAALALVGVVLSLAGLYFLQGTSFVAVAQMLVYSGGVVVLLLFSLGLLPPAVPTTGANVYSQVIPLLAVGLLTGTMGYATCPPLPAVPTTTPTAPPPAAHPVAYLGSLLLGPYAWAFEWTGVILLVALVGAVYTIGRQRPQ